MTLVAAGALGSAIGLGAAKAQTSEPPRVLLQGDEITYDSNTGVVTAEGHVEISDDQRTLLADKVTYDENTNTVTASGNVSLQDATGTVAYADSVELTQDLREGALQGFAALIGQSGRLAASSGERREGRFTIAHGAIFTPCTICKDDGERMPLWQIRAARIVHDELEKEIYFEDAAFEFLGVPILYLPYFSEADPTVKYKSGFLLPDIGTIGAIGSFIKIPYYISLSPSRDLTLDPFITTQGGTVLQTEYRERWGAGGMWLQGTLGYDSSAAGKPGESIWMGSLFGSGRVPLNDDGWRAGFDVQLASNKTYLKRYELSNLDRLTSSLFTDDVEGRSRAAITGYFFQSLRATDVTAQMPLALPLLEYTYIPEYKVWGGRFRADTSALYLDRTQGTNMLRGSLDADWRLPFTTNDGQLITFETFLRGDAYYISDTAFDVPGAVKSTETIGRMLGYGMVEWRYPFVSDINIPNTTLVVEPIAQLVAASGGGNPVGLPNEDSTAFEFDITNLFSANPAPGLDLWTGGPRSNVGVRASVLLPGGTVEAMLGEQFRFTTDSSLPTGLRLNDDKSDIVGQFKIEFPNIALTHQFNIDPDDGTIRRNEVYLRARFGRSVVDLSYLKLPQSAADPTLGEQEQINLTTTVQVYRNWGVFGEIRRDLAKNQELESSIGITYDDECFVASLGFHRRDTATLNLKPSSAVIFRLGLKTGYTAR
ncbi:MAG TPA: LPS assembly protein LptD [Micropepsaceae bacterium]|nr:LPS assembly protein LptD [Micropepsaceae bacterium]